MADQQLTLGVFGTAFKENEKRVPLHPSHLARIPAELRSRIFLERGYAAHFGARDEELAALVGGLATREELFARCDVLLLPKPVEADFPYLREGQVLWGWPHLVQGPAITQCGIDKKLTMITWEGMHVWDGDRFVVHVFHQNNELAGYASVLHALSLRGRTGAYGSRRRAAVIGFGSAGRGAVHALQGLGFEDVTVFLNRPTGAVAQPIPRVTRKHFRRVAEGADGTEVVNEDGAAVPMGEVLAGFDVVVNCIWQDTDAPLMFITQADLAHVKPGSILVDVSCDEGMGWEFARPTGFGSPTFEVGDRVTCYAVDHSPSYLWDAASEEISRALLPFLPKVLAGPDAWRADLTLLRALEMHDGVILNPAILRFQDRAEDYPHAKR